MAYRPLEQPVGLPRLVARLIWKLERHYLAPTHALLRLPIQNYRIDGEFASSIAHLLLAAVAGVSTTLFAQSGGSGDRFRRLLTTYYPFAQEPANAASAADAAKALWSVFRNPLAHDLGFDLDGRAQTPEVKLLRVKTRTNTGTRGLTERMIERLETPGTRPASTATVAIRTDATVLSIDMFYWSVRSMIEALLKDGQRMSSAESYLATL